jgi:hypothetical protein
MAQYLTIPAGQYIFREGDAGSEMYIIVSGSVDILRKARGKTPIAELAAGDFFGEMAILEDQPRFATARAKLDTQLLRVAREGFGQLLQNDVEIAVRIMRKSAARLRRSESQLAQMAETILEMRTKLSSKSRRVPVVPAPTGASPHGAPVLCLRHRDGTVFEITTAQHEWLIGRPDPVTGIVPALNLDPLDRERRLSRRHAKILLEGNLVFLREEVGVANGTWLNGVQLKAGVSTPIQVGDTLVLGTIELLVQRPDAAKGG